MNIRNQIISVNSDIIIDVEVQNTGRTIKNNSVIILNVNNQNASGDKFKLLIDCIMSPKIPVPVSHTISAENCCSVSIL